MNSRTILTWRNFWHGKLFFSYYYLLRGIMLLYRRTQKLVPLQAGETTSNPKGTIVRGGDAHATSVSSFVVTTDFSAILGHGVLGAKALRNGAAGWIPCGIFSFHHVKHSLVQTEFQKYLILDNTTVLLLLFIIYVFFLVSHRLWLRER